eukprot:CAMPEP_0173093176 /NCGR_PEP_ID=MMETSP1102-20130122/29783_1 /TAXON_ID=49646 /ORGANISM="Geminigera sp., Strain Caron Lab Isolate" /LENGTH=78 /DNA_ID=CAMNT_0013981039 /DNA_START=1 /DNA_END=233 /DNA_ORIENTATION=+
MPTKEANALALGTDIPAREACVDVDTEQMGPMNNLHFAELYLAAATGQTKAKDCSALQHAATQSGTWQHTATHCNTLA